MKNIIRLGVNVDHVATIRQARLTRYPSPVQAALIAEQAGADGITIHLREDRRHIQEADVLHINELIKTSLNLEVAVTEEMLAFALKVKPQFVCLVPEKREELTTEGGLNVIKHYDAISSMTQKLQQANIEVSLFIDPCQKQIQASYDLKADAIELHTGCYAEKTNPTDIKNEYIKINQAAMMAHELGLIVNAGHGLDYHNVKPIAAIACINELNIGHAIVARALISGMDTAVRDMRALLNESR